MLVGLMILGSVLATRPPATPVPGILARVTPQRVHADVSTLAGFGTRHTLSQTDSATRGIGAARTWLKAEFERANLPSASELSPGRLDVRFEEFEVPPGTRVPNGGTLVNVVAVLPGTMPEAQARRYYVVGHYDSMPSDVMDPNTDAPGANDDASGTSVVLECARVLAREQFDATIVFLCTAGEEQGLLGAKFHADAAKARGERILGVLSNDIVGDPWGPGGDKARSTPTIIRVFSEGLPRNASQEDLARIRSLAAETDSASRQLARFVAEIAKREHTVIQPMLVFRQDRFLRGGDHSSFNEAGFAAVRFTEVHEDYRHQHQTPRVEKGPDGVEIRYGDLPEHVDAEYLANVARLNAAALVHLANAPAPPDRVRVLTAKLEYTTTLRWNPCTEPDVAGYEVVWRETTAADWQHARDVGNVTEATIDESKDNVFFGVRAYDRDGYKSPVAFAGAARE